MYPHRTRSWVQALHWFHKLVGRYALLCSFSLHTARSHAYFSLLPSGTAGPFQWQETSSDCISGSSNLRVANEKRMRCPVLSHESLVEFSSNIEFVARGCTESGKYTIRRGSSQSLLCYSRITDPLFEPIRITYQEGKAVMDRVSSSLFLIPVFFFTLPCFRFCSQFGRILLRLHINLRISGKWVSHSKASHVGKTRRDESSSVAISSLRGTKCSKRNKKKVIRGKRIKKSAMETN